MKSKELTFSPLVDYWQQSFPVDWQKIFHRKADLVVEIGFGLGEELMRLSHHNLQINFLGIEQNWERIYKTLKQIQLKNLDSNIRILDIDARMAFSWLLKSRSIKKVFSLFPCPWPKRAHEHHRLFSKEFLRLINNRLVSDGELYIVTDYKDYAQWIFKEATQTGFVVNTNNIDSQFNTKFERKWKSKGQQQFYEIKLVKKDHQEAKIAELVELKSYKIKSLDPKKISIPDQTGATSIIFKKKFYDEPQQKVLVQVVVVENHISQYFLIEIIHRKDHWLIHKFEGQQIFQTPGLQKALDLVYETISATSN